MKCRYRQTIEAVRWDGKNFSEVPEWLDVCLRTKTIVIDGDKVLVNLINNTIVALPNSYIIRFENGEKDVISTKLFNKYFEEIK